MEENCKEVFRMSPIVKAFLGSLAMVVFAGTSMARAGDTPQKAAETAAEAWLALVDSSDYAASWEEAAEIFKAHVNKEQWEKAARSTREPLGRLTSRKFSSAQYTKQLPGVPDGEYVVIQYESSFENKSSAVETVTPALDKDGKWRVSGYFIR